MRNILFSSALAIVFAFPAYAQVGVEGVEDVSAVETPVSPDAVAAEADMPPEDVDASQAPAPAANAPVSPSTNGDVVAALPSPDQPQPAVTAMEKEINQRLSYLRPNVDLTKMPSLFFSIWEHDLVSDARRGLTTRAPGIDDGVAPVSGPRDIALGGIVYAGSKDWTIWLNNIRVSPTAIPEEVMDLKVYKEYIELEWFDGSTNQIYPIRLRAHQRFNLDTRMFLPG